LLKKFDGLQQNVAFQKIASRTREAMESSLAGDDFNSEAF